MLLLLLLPCTKRKAYNNTLNATRLVPVIAEYPTARSACMEDIPVLRRIIVTIDEYGEVDEEVEEEDVEEEEGFALLLAAAAAAT